MHLNPKKPSRKSANPEGFLVWEMKTYFFGFLPNQVNALFIMRKVISEMKKHIRRCVVFFLVLFGVVAKTI
jgi:hypothetical protein